MQMIIDQWIPTKSRENWENLSMEAPEISEDTVGSMEIQKISRLPLDFGLKMKL